MSKVKFDPVILKHLREQGLVGRSKFIGGVVAVWLGVANISALWLWLTPSEAWQAALIFFPVAAVCLFVGSTVAGAYFMLGYLTCKDDIYEAWIRKCEQLSDRDSDMPGGDGD